MNVVVPNATRLRRLRRIHAADTQPRSVNFDHTVPGYLTYTGTDLHPPTSRTFSFAALVKCTDPGSYTSIATCADDSNQAWWAALSSNSLNINLGTNFGVSIGTPANTWLANEIHLATGGYDTSSSPDTLWVKMDDQPRAFSYYAFVTMGPAGKLYLGIRNASGTISLPFDGNLQAFFLFNGYSLTDADVSQIYQGGLFTPVFSDLPAGLQAKCTAAWNLNDQTGDQVDVVGNRHLVATAGGILLNQPSLAG